jgi:hypothetical protein
MQVFYAIRVQVCALLVMFTFSYTYLSSFCPGDKNSLKNSLKYLYN